MDKKDVTAFLGFLGSARSANPPHAWDLRQFKYASIHFSMNGEDAALRHLFKWRIAARKPGVYVDLGCFHPVVISNTYLFYTLGWRGLCIDANGAWKSAWSDTRPEDVFENVAVGEGEGTAYWFEHKTNNGMSLVRPTSAPFSEDYNSTATAVPVVRLDNLFSRHLAGKSIQLLSLDIEGAELPALQSNDWSRWKPEVIVAEMREFDFLAPKESPVVAYLCGLGYRLEGKVGANVIFASPEYFATEEAFRTL